MGYPASIACAGGRPSPAAPDFPVVEIGSPFSESRPQAGDRRCTLVIPMLVRDPDVAAAGERPDDAHPDARLVRAFTEGEPAAVRRVERWAWEIVHFRWGSIPLADRAD